MKTSFDFREYGVELNYSHLLLLLVYLWTYGFPSFGSSKRKRGISVESNGTAAPGSPNKRESRGRGRSQRVDETSSINVKAEATQEEQDRFLIGCKNNTRKAEASLRKYLLWRRKYLRALQEVPGDQQSQLSLETDQECWQIACRTSLQLAGLDVSTRLPQIIQVHNDCRGKNATPTRCFQILPGMMAGVKDLSVFSTAVAIYFDRKLSRSSREKVTVVIDVRGGKGWANPHVRQLVPCIQKTIVLLLTMFPERLSKAVVYPIPSSYMWVWRLLRRCIDPTTREKILIVAGAATIVAPPPSKELSLHLGVKTTEAMEKYRISCFS